MYIIVEVSKQRLSLFNSDRKIRSFFISTSKYGVGNKTRSNKTPLGRHKIVRKIGDGAPIGTIFVHRRNQGRITKIFNRKPKAIQKVDLITTRILRLRGLEIGINKGKEIDSYNRYIYIHGTPQEWLIGKPASHGCIRMKNKDIIKLFNIVPSGAMVLIER